jgi:outer membrane protein assembly factor BamB
MAVLVESGHGVWGSLRLVKAVLIHQGRQGILSSPLAAGSGIYVAEWYKTGDLAKVDRHSLRVVWRVNTALPNAKPAEGLSPSSTWSDDFILVGAQSRIGMMEVESGRLRWIVSRASAPKIWNGHVVARTDGAILLIDGLTGEIASRVRVPWPTDSVFVLCDGRVIPSPTSGGSMGCLDLGRGEVEWQRDVLMEMCEFARVRFESSAVGLAAGSRPNSFVATRGSAIFGLSVEDGSIRWVAPVTVTYHWPNIHEGRIYVLLMDHFICLDEATGEIVYDVRHPQLGEAFLPKTGTIYAGKIAFAMETGHLAVFDLADGRLVWLYKHKVKLGRTAAADGRLLATSDDGHLLVFDEARH